MKKRVLSVLLALIIAVSGRAFGQDPSSSIPSQRAAEEMPNPILRVCIDDWSRTITLAIKSGFRMMSLDTGEVLLDEPSFDGKVSVTPDGILFGDKLFTDRGVGIEVANDSTIYIDGKRFRGHIDLIRINQAAMMIINHIPLEYYLYGVLHYEVSERWPMAALQAQAIAARTFAMVQARQNRIKPYDLRNDIYSQVYGGSGTEKWATTKAVDLTKGKVLTYNGDILSAYYHAACAGSTEDASEIWNINIQPLKGVKCNYCAGSPYAAWTRDISFVTLQEKLNKGGVKIGKISAVKVLSKNKSGRVDKIQITDKTGKTAILKAKDFRQIIGPNEIKSTKFSIVSKWGHLIINGQGWGHGVGLCQWGMLGLAKLGKSADDILKFYYPGSRILTLDKIKNKL